MDPIEQLAEAALQRDSLRLRSLVQDMTRAHINWSSLSRPQNKRRTPVGNFRLTGRTTGCAAKPNPARLDKGNRRPKRTLLPASLR